MVKPKHEVEEEEERNSTFKYRGVRKRKWGKWVSEIRLPNSRQRIWLGSYDTAEKAARAFDAAMFCLRGLNGRFNFPDNPPDIATDSSMTPAQIQAAAALFAESEPRLCCSGRPEKSESAVECSSEATSLKLDSPSPSLSEGTVQVDSNSTLSGSVFDYVVPFGPGCFPPEYGIFPGYDDFIGEFYVPQLQSVDFDEENLDGLIVDGHFLWNF